MYKILRLFGINRTYYGYYPFVNILVTNLIFWTLNYRRFRLKLYFRFTGKNKIPKVILINDASTKEKLMAFLNKGYTKLSIGGGKKNLEGFVNIDFAEHKNIEREVVANILDLSFVPSESITHIHSNHVVEHLSQHDLVRNLSEYKRILKKEGIISIRCPNALGVSYGFFFDIVPETDHEKFLKLGYPKEEEFYNPNDRWYYKDLYGFYHWIYAQTGNIENVHLNILTPTKLRKTVETAGFKILKMSDPETSNLVLIAQKLSD